MKRMTNSFKKFAIIIVLLLMLASIVLSAGALTNNAAFAAEHSEEEKQTEVFSYKEVFEEYYDAVCADLDKATEEYMLTFKDFSNGYYYNGFCYDNEITIADYTLMIYEYVKENGKYEYEDKLISTYSDSSSKNADYFLASLADYTVTPASEFERRPNYSGYEGQSFKLRECVKNGDIIHETNAAAGFGHTGVVVDANHQSEYGTYIQTIESVQPYVRYAFLDDTRMVDFGVIVVRVEDITDSVSQTVKYFCEQQLGKPYDLDIYRTNTSIDSTQWYCSEMVYAAFRYAGLDIIDRTTNNVPKNVLPTEILDSKYTYEKCVRGKEYLDISLVGIGWTIRIHNNTGADRVVEYNSKMCFKSDAANWTNLKDVHTINIPSGSKAEVTITGNWFATSVALSYTLNSVRYITFADNLQAADLNYNFSLIMYFSIK